MRLIVQRIAASLYGAWVVLVLLLVTLTTVILLAIVPGLDRRRRLVRRAAAAIFRLAGMPLVIRGLHHIPETSCIVVANHASYLDGFILTAVLPPRFGFVIKREITRVPIAHFLLRRIGSEFVERFDTQRGAIDARRILQKATARESLAFFPEGTFRAEAGLQRFRNGAFTAAVRGTLPVVPVVIRGSRALLPADRLLPRRGPIEVIITPVLMPGDHGDVRALADAARQRILGELGEPDLT